MAKQVKKIVAVIPCRIYSTRLLVKPLQNIGNHTILELLIKQLKTSRKINGIVLAIAKTTGSELFVKFAQENKLKYVLGSEKDVLGRFIKTAKISKADVVVRITSENPFIYWQGIDELITKHLEEKYDLSCHYKLPVGAGLEIINLKSLKIAHKFGNKLDKEHCTPYIYENAKKFKILKFKPIKKLERPDLRLTVDTPQDLWVARLIYNNFKSNGKPISLIKIIEFLDKNPKIKKINSNLKHKKRYI